MGIAARHGLILDVCVTYRTLANWYADAVYSRCLALDSLTSGSFRTKLFARRKRTHALDPPLYIASTIAIRHNRLENLNFHYKENALYSFFFQRVPPLRVDDLIEDLKDGTRLLALLEVLSGEKLVL